jgi:hypothetical protein
MRAFGRETALPYVLFILTLSPFHCSFSAQSSGTVTAGILKPVVDAQGNVVRSSAPDGRTYPVFCLAEESALAQQVRTVLETSFAQKVLRLDRYTRNLLLSL